MRRLLLASLLCFTSATTLAATCTSVPVTFKVNDPAAIAGQAMHVNGDQDALGKWTAVVANTMKREGQSMNWSATFELPPDTPFQFKFMKRQGAMDTWEAGIATYGENREARTPACGARGFTIDGGAFRQAEREDNPATDDGVGPKGKKRAHIDAMLAALNSNSPEAVRAFMQLHTAPSLLNAAPMEKHQEIFSEVFQETRGLDWRAFRSYKYPVPETVIVAQDRAYESWHGVTVAFETGGEERITGVGRLGVKPPTQKPISEEIAFGSVKGITLRACEKGVFSGSILISKQGKVLFEHACGEASKRYHAANNLDTKFNLGSMNKMFTSLAISQLVEQGKLKYTDTIDAFVDETWLPKSITSQVTIHHLLSHTSGLGSYFNDKYWNSSRLLYRDVNDYKPLVVGDKLAFKPGERFGYSNTGMLLLGVVIEKVTGKSYFEVIRTNITGPAGMSNTDSYAMDDPVENLATGYIPAPGPLKWTENSLMHVLKGGPAGGGYSTVRDLDRFTNYLLAGKFVKRETLERHWTDHIKARYGYGFQVSTGSAGKVVGHSGGFPGLNGQLDIYLDRGVTVAVLANQDGGASPLANKIGELLGRVK